MIGDLDLFFLGRNIRARWHNGDQRHPTGILVPEVGLLTYFVVDIVAIRECGHLLGVQNGTELTPPLARRGKGNVTVRVGK